MTFSWATFGVDLHLDLAPRGRRVGLETALRQAIQSGRLGPGTRLPSSRQLAADLAVARNTVADAYGQLVAEGWLTARQGSGTRVSTLAATLQHRPVVRGGTRPGPETVALDLRPGHPDVSSFPRAVWLAALRRALAAAPESAMGYDDPQGRADLRDALASYLARTRGVHADPERIVVCSGFTQGLDLLSRVLAQRGATTMAVESHGHHSHHRVITRNGLTLRAVPVDHDGLVAERLGGEDAVLVSPAHQFPLGPSCSAPRRSGLVAWAARTSAMVVEDDYDGEFRYDRAPLGALQAMAPDAVVYAGTASKTLAPGLRLGWLVVPPAWLDDVVAAKRDADAHPAVLEQLAMAEMITSGAYDRHVRQRRTAYRRRRDRLVEVLDQRVPEVVVTGLAAGLHAVVTLPAGLGEADAHRRAEDEGLALEGLDSFRITGARHPAALVVGYATPPDRAFEGALQALCRALSPA